MTARLWVWARQHPVAIGIVTALIAVQAAWKVGAAVCPRMTMTACVTTATALVVGASVTGIAVRAGWLAATTARAVTRLPRAPVSESLLTAGRRAGIARVRCVAGTDRTAFCAGLLRPVVYVTTAAADLLSPAELDAVLAHEAAHARRRDPLRRLLTRAAADVLFWLPLLRWWLRTHVENAELQADKAAINHAGRQALAAALLAADTQPPAAQPLSALPGMAGATQTRVAHLLGDDLPPRRPPASLIALSLLGAIGAIWLLMCLGQGALAALGF